MAAGTSTPTEAGGGKSVLGIAAGIGAKIRDAAEEAKQEREKAQEKGMETKKGSLFKSALGNKFNPVKSNKAKAQWAKQFDWNKKSPDTAQEVKTPSDTGGSEGKAKLKEFIAGGFTAIIKDTTAMRAKMDGIQALSNANLEQATRTTGSLTMIKDSVDAQTEIRRKALEQAKFAKSERRLERTKDSAGLTGTKGKGGSAEEQPGQDDKGGGIFDTIMNALGIGDLLSNFFPKGGFGAILSKINPFKGPTTRGGTPITGTRPRSGGNARVTTTGGATVPKPRTKIPGLRGGILSAIFAAFEFKGRKDEGQTNLQAGIGTAASTGGGMAGAAAGGKAGAILGGTIGAAFGGVGAIPGAAIGGVLGSILGGIGGSMAGGAMADAMTGVDKTTESLGPNPLSSSAADMSMGLGSFSEGGIVPGAVPLNRGGIVDNPVRTMLNPGDKVIPLNRSAGRDMLSEGSGDLPMQAQAAMILGISAGMLGQSMTGSTGDSVKQKIRAASKGFGISNLNFTSAVGSGRLGKVDMNQSAENFMENMLKHFKMAGGTTAGGDRPDTSGGGGNPPAPAAAAGLKAELEADLGKDASQMKNEIMQSGAGGLVNPEEQPWCAAYVNSQLKRQGIMGSGSAAADSYSNWGAPVDKAHIKYGDVIVGDYGGGSKSHVMFAAGSPKDGAVDIIGGNQSGRVTRGRIQLTKIDYVRRASESVVVRQPDAANPAAKPELPPATSVEREAESGGSWLNPFNWGKKTDESRDTAKIGYNKRYENVTDPNMRRMLGLPPKQYQGGGRGDFRDLQVKPYNPDKKYKTGDYVRKDGQLLKFDGFGFASADANAITSQNLTPNAAPPRPAPPKTEPQQTIPPRQPVAETAAAVVAPPTQNIGKKTASAAGSFGSAIPSAKVAAGNFADFLYYDLV